MTAPRRTVALLTGSQDDTCAPGHEARGFDRLVDLRPPGRNFALDAGRLARQLRCTIPPRLQDLIEIAATVYGADLALKRGENEQWVRSIFCLIPVRDADFWRSIEPQLAEFLYVLSHDSFEFEFPARAERAEGPGDILPDDALQGFDCVALLSGGIDSFSGATALLATGRTPLFVAHRPQNALVAAAQEHVRECLEARFGRRVEVVVDRSGPVRPEGAAQPFPPPEAREPSQRTRSFLYLSLAAVACRAADVRQLICPENGVLAINPPLTEARVGGNSTAGARPRALAQFADLLAAAGLPVEVENPFIYQTKGQLIRDVLRPQFSARQIQGTVSCWMAGRASRPCGGCVPCLVRTVAMQAAGLPAEAHVVDPLGPEQMAGRHTDARANLVDLISLARRVSRLADAELLREYPVLLDLPPAVNVGEAIGMLRRFADEVHQATTSLRIARA